MTDKALVSVLIPCFNRARWVGETIASVATQSCRDLELIVIDDGSTDDSLKVIEEAVAKGSFDRPPLLVSRPNLGFVPTLIEGLGRASGEYFAYLDSDDVWLPEKLARQSAALEHGGDQVGACFSDCWVIDKGGERTDRLGRQYPYRGGDIYLDLLLSRFFPPSPTVVFNRQILVSIGGFNPHRAIPDRDVWMRLARAYRVVYVPEPLALYRVHGDNMNRRDLEGNFESILASLHDAIERDPWLEEYRGKIEGGTRARLAGAYYETLKMSRARAEAVRALRHDPANRLAWRIMLGSLLGRKVVGSIRAHRRRRLSE